MTTSMVWINFNFSGTFDWCRSCMICTYMHIVQAIKVPPCIWNIWARKGGKWPILARNLRANSRRIKKKKKLRWTMKKCLTKIFFKVIRQKFASVDPKNQTIYLTVLQSHSLIFNIITFYLGSVKIIFLSWNTLHNF